MTSTFKSILLAFLFSNAVSAGGEGRGHLRASESAGMPGRQLTSSSVFTKLSSDEPSSSDIFYIINKNAAAALEVADSSCSNGAQLQLANFTGGTNQRFTLDSDGYLYPEHCSNGAKIGLSGGTCTDGTNLILWDTVSETWEMSYGDGIIRSLTCSGKVMDFTDPVASNTTTNPIYISTSDSSTNQMYSLAIHYDDADGELTFESRSSVNKVLSVATGGTNIQVWDYEASNPDQLFSYTGNRIIHIESGDAVSLVGDDVSLEINSGTDDQIWFFFADGKIASLRDLPDNKVMGASTSRNYQNGDNMVVATQSGVGSQQFDVNVISSSSSGSSNDSSDSSDGSSSLSSFYENYKLVILAGGAIVIGIAVILIVMGGKSSNKEIDDE